MDIKGIVLAHWDIQATKIAQLPGAGSTLYQQHSGKGKAVTIPPTRIDTADNNVSYALRAYPAHTVERVLYQTRMQLALRADKQFGLQDVLPEIVRPLSESSLAGKFGKTDAAKTGLSIAAIKLHLPGFSNDDDDDDDSAAGFFSNCSAILLVLSRFRFKGEQVTRQDGTAEHYAALGQFAGKLRKAARTLNDGECAALGRAPLVRPTDPTAQQGNVNNKRYDEDADDAQPVHVFKYKSRSDVITQFFKSEEGQWQMKNNKVLESAVNAFMKNTTAQMYKLHNNEETLWSLVIHNRLGFGSVRFERDVKYNKLYVCSVFDFDLAQADWGVVEFNHLILGTAAYGPMQPVDPTNLAACWKAYVTALNAGGPLATGIMKSLLDQQTEVEYNLAIEVLRSRLIEEVFRHETKQYPPAVLNNAAFTEVRENRKVVLRKFMETFPPQQ